MHTDSKQMLLQTVLNHSNNKFAASDIMYNFVLQLNMCVIQPFIKAWLISQQNNPKCCEKIIGPLTSFHHNRLTPDKISANITGICESNFRVNRMTS